MIEKVSNNSGVTPAAVQTQKAASDRTVRRTPFGDVMLDELSTSNRASILGGQPERKSTPAVMQLAVAEPTEQAAVPASTVQTATAAAAQAAVPASTVQTATAATAQAAAAADASAQDAFPTAESVFGANPWITNPTGTAPDGSSYGYNPLYFATPATAAKVAQLVGGQVVASDQIASAGGFAQQQPNEMVELPNGTLINAGLVASFYTHGESQACVDQMIQNEIEGA
jgi:hypothetical protein